MQVMAQGWLVYRITDSPLMLGLVSFIGLLPVVPMTFLAGVISDRYPRRTIMVITESVLMVQAVVLAVIVWLDKVMIWHIIVLSFVYGIAAALEQPSRLTFVSDIVGKEDLTNAVALNASAYNSARIIGPALAGFLIAEVGEAGCFIINALTYLVLILALVFMRVPTVTLVKSKMDLAGSWLGGILYSWKSQHIREILIVVATASFFLFHYLTLMPIFARDILQVGPTGLGSLMAATGAGAIIGAMLVAGIHEGRRGKWLTISNVLASALLIFFVISRFYLLSVILIILVGVTNAIRTTLANSLLQLSSSEEYRGRVMSIFFLSFSGMTQVGTLAAGALADVIGATMAVTIFAAINLFLALAFIWGMPSLYRYK
jgi:MFS family permease